MLSNLDKQDECNSKAYAYVSVDMSRIPDGQLSSTEESTSKVKATAVSNVKAITDGDEELVKEEADDNDDDDDGDGDTDDDDDDDKDEDKASPASTGSSDESESEDSDELGSAAKLFHPGTTKVMMAFTAILGAAFVWTA